MRGVVIAVLSALCLFILCPAGARAQSVPPPAPAYSPGYRSGSSAYNGGVDSEYVRKARQMRNVGIPLTIAGAIALPMGIILASAGGGCWYQGSCGYGTYVALSTFGAIGIVGGVATLGAGIPLWAVGSHRLRRAGMSEARFSLAPGFGLDPGGGPAGRMQLAMTF